MVLGKPKEMSSNNNRGRKAEVAPYWSQSQSQSRQGRGRSKRRRLLNLNHQKAWLPGLSVPPAGCRAPKAPCVFSGEERLAKDGGGGLLQVWCPFSCEEVGVGLGKV